MNIQSVIYPELLLALPSGSVQFVDGSAFVTDKALVDEVREIVARASDLGIVVPDEAVSDLGIVVPDEAASDLGIVVPDETAPAEGGKLGKKPGKKPGKKVEELV